MTVAPADPRGSAVLVEALRKAAVLWVTPDGHRPVPVWLARRESTVYVLTGGGEQRVPGLATARSATLSARSRDDRALLVTWDAAVEQVAPATPEWDEATQLLLTARLNLPETGEGAALARWAAHCTLVRLAPTGPVRPRTHVGTSRAEGDR